MFVAEYCGYNTHNPDRDTIYRPNGSTNFLFLLILSPMHFYFNGQEYLAKPGACILFTPGHSQHYQAVKTFVNSFIHFVCDEEFISKYSFPVNRIFYPGKTDNINWYIKKIHMEHLLKAPHQLDIINALITELLIQIDRACQQRELEPLTSAFTYSEFQAFRIQMLTSCEEDWDIKRMCQIMNLEKSQLYSYYKEFLNCTPKTELINARIDKAKYLLTNEALQISQVASMSGFINIYHFCRYFKSVCGCTPSEFRKKYKFASSVS